MSEVTHARHEHLNTLLMELLRQGDRLLGSRAISMTEALALHHLDHSGPCSQQELAAVLGIDKSTMSRAVTALAEAGAIDRTRAEGNRRVVIVSITAQGHQLHRDIGETMSARTCGVLEAMTESERKALEVGLAALLRELG